MDLRTFNEIANRRILFIVFHGEIDEKPKSTTARKLSRRDNIVAYTKFTPMTVTLGRCDANNKNMISKSFFEQFECYFPLN